VEKYQGIIEKYSPYFEDIRKRVYFLAISFIVFFIIGFLSTRYILHFILWIFDIQNVVIATTSPFQFADLSIDIGLSSAFIISAPLLIFHIFRFLRPALTKGERRLFFVLIPITVLLFMSGFIYGFFIMYYALEVLAEINRGLGIQNIWDIGLFVSQVVLTSILLGVLFEFPVIFTFIIRMGIISVESLRGKRRVAIAIIFVFTSLLPPTDGLSLLAMALPLILLYEVTIFVNSKMWKVRAREIVGQR